MPVEPLVLLPGMNCSPLLWAGVEAALVEHGVDVRHATLDAPDLEECADALLAALPERFALAGLSLGGIVAMALVRKAPQRVTRLCLVSTNSRPPTGAQRAGWAAQLSRLRDGATARELQAELLPVLLHSPADPEVVRQVLAMADQVGGAVLARQLLMQGTRIDERPGLSQVKVPTLVVAAEHDRLCPIERHEEIHTLIPGSRLLMLPETGHLAPLERPERVAAELRQWFSARLRCSVRD